MKKNKIVFLSLSLLLISFFINLNFSFAQIKTPDISNLTMEEKVELFKQGKIPPQMLQEQIPENSFQGLSDCFQDYKFGSVSVNVVGDKLSYTAGDIVKVEANIKNNNPYPVINGAVYIKIMRKEKDFGTNGHNVISQYFPLNNINIAAMGSATSSFDFTLPKDIPNGEYKIATYFITNEKFNLLGLSFTDDIIGNSFDFNVNNSSKEQGLVYLSKNNVKVNDTDFYFAKPAPKFSDEKDKVISFYVVNDTDQNADKTINYSVRNWDINGPLIYKNSIQVKVKAKSKTKVTINVPYTKDQIVSYVVVSIENNDKAKADSFLNIRYVNENLNWERINFPSVMKFPIKENDNTKIFSCFHSVTRDLVNGGELDISLIDNNTGDTIISKKYTGGIPGAMSGFEAPFISTKNYYDVTLNATLKTPNTNESISLIYSCKKNPEICNLSEEEKQDLENQKLEITNQNKYQIQNYKNVILVLIVLIVLGGGILIIKNKRSDSNNIKNN